MGEDYNRNAKCYSKGHIKKAELKQEIKKKMENGVKFAPLFCASKEFFFVDGKCKKEIQFRDQRPKRW